MAVGTHAPCQKAGSPLIPPSAAGTVHNAVRTAEGGGGLCLRAAAALTPILDCGLNTANHGAATTELHLRVPIRQPLPSTDG